MNANLQSLVDLGIPKAKARFALTEFEDNLEVAANWCYSEVRPLCSPRDELSTLAGPRLDPLLPSQQHRRRSSPSRRFVLSPSFPQHVLRSHLSSSVRLQTTAAPPLYTWDKGVDRDEAGPIDGEAGRGSRGGGVDERGSSEGSQGALGGWARGEGGGTAVRNAELVSRGAGLLAVEGGGCPSFVWEALAALLS